MAVNYGMKVYKYLMAVWAAIAAYSVLSLVYGAAGLYAYEQLCAERELQWENMRNLGLINAELENVYNDLRYDRDELAVYARLLGYGRKNERFAHIVGQRTAPNPHTEVGEVVETMPPEYVPDRILKIIALFVGFLVLIIMMIIEFMRRDGKPKNPLPL